MKALVKKIAPLETILLLAVACYPALALTVKGGMNAAFAVIALASILMLATRHVPIRELFADRTTLWFALAMSSGALAILANQIYYWHFDYHPFDAELRFILAILVFAALRNLGNRIFNMLEYAFPAGVLLFLVFAQIQLPPNGRFRTPFLDSIHLGEISLVLGFLSLFSINWLRRDPFFFLAIKLAGFAAGIYVSIQSGSRGVWLAIPVLTLLWFASMQKRLISIKTMTALIVAVCFLSYSLIDIVRERVDLAFANLASYSDGQVNNGTAARLELWKVAFLLSKENSLIGIETGSLNEKLGALHNEGVINDLVLKEGMAEMHSEIASRMAKYGMFGATSAIIVLLIPGWLFYKSLNSTNQAITGGARMGLLLVSGFFIFGLTVEVFNIKMVAAFYSLTVALLLTGIHSIPQQPTR